MASNQTETAYKMVWQQDFHSTLIFFACLIILLNVPVIILFLKISSLRYSAGNSFLCGLAIADILCAVVMIPSLLLCEVDVFPNKTRLRICRFYFVSNFTISITCIYHIVAANVAKYFALVFPMRNITAFTKSRVTYTILVIWVMAFLIGHIPIYWPYLSESQFDKLITIYNYFLLAFSFILPILILLVTHVHIYTNLFFKSRLRTQNSGTTFTSTGQGTLRENNWRITILFFILFTVFIVSWLPWYLMGLGLLDYSNDYLISFRFIAPILNPLVFTFVKRDFRMAATTLVKRLCGFGPRGRFSEHSRFTWSKTEQSLDNYRASTTENNPEAGTSNTLVMCESNSNNSKVKI